MKHEFKFNLSQEVKIDVSGETGTVIAASVHEQCEDQFNIRYRAADGRAVESWWSESALSAA